MQLKLLLSTSTPIHTRGVNSTGPGFLEILLVLKNMMKMSTLILTNIGGRHKAQGTRQV